MTVYKMAAAPNAGSAQNANGAQFRVYTSNNGNNTIPFESQLLSVGGGFVIFVALVAFLATIQRRKLAKRGSREFHSPLIPQQIASLKSFEKNFPRVGLCASEIKPYSVSSAKSFSGGFDQPNMNLSPRLSLQNPRRNPNSIVSNLSSPSSSSNSSEVSPQCTPLNPYNSFGTTIENITRGGDNRKGSAYKNLPEHRGNISLQLQYDAVNTTLQVTILACHDLPELNSIQNPMPHQQSLLNPYVKLRILPDNQHRVKTRVLKGTRNPMYDETFTLYGITEANIQNYSLHLAVLAFDRYSRDIILGETVYTLGTQHELMDTRQKLNVNLKLKARQSFGDQRGQLLVSMAHNPQSNSLNFAVLKVKDLPVDPSIGLIDPFIKVYMLVNGQKIAKQKTHVKRKCHDAVFNESFSFKLPSFNNDLEAGRAPQLDSVTFKLLVLNHDGVTRNEVVGQCDIDVDSIQMAQVRGAPGKQIAEWYTIQQP